MRRRGAQTAAEAFARILARAVPDGECLLLGPTNRYVPVRVAGRLTPAHRVAYEAVYGPPPEAAPLVLHSCIGRENCIAPLHLRAGTSAENSRDMVEQGRSLRGERHNKARLRTRQVREARKLRAQGARITDLAQRYGVAPSTIGAAITGATWGHV